METKEPTRTKRIIEALLLLMLIGILAACAVSGFAIFFLLADDVPTENPRTAEPEKFPVLEGTNLRGRQLTVPDDLRGQYKLVVVAYDSDQQERVVEWLAPLEDLNTDYPELAGYYVPILPTETADNAFAILTGMFLFADDRDRNRTIVVFTNVAAFNDLVEVDGVDEIQLFLLDAENFIIWQTGGDYTPEKLATLREVLDGDFGDG